MRELIAGDQERAGWVQVEEARMIAARRFAPDEREFAGVFDPAHGDAVVTAIGAVEILAVRGDMDVGGGVGFGEVFRQCGDQRQRCERPGGGIVTIGLDGRQQLVEDIQQVTVGMKCKVAGT